MREIALLSGTQQPSTRILSIVVLLRVSLPFLIRYLQQGSPVPGFAWDSWLYSVLESIIGGLFFLQNYLFVFGGCLDFKRREIMMRACGALIDPDKANYSALYKQNPTINIASPQKLRAWFQMRSSLMDLGLKYLERIFLYSSTFIGFYLIFLAVVLLKYFGFFNIELSPMFLALGMFDVVFVLGVNLMMLNYGAQVNE